MATEATHRFDQTLHEYIVDGRKVPGITDMLLATGEIDDRFYTDEGRDRGTQVHRLTLDYDLGAIALDDVVSKFRGYLLGWAKVVDVIQPEFVHLEETFTHPSLWFGGTPDRVGKWMGLDENVGEIKTGDYVRPKRRGQPGPHELQLALQAILVGAHRHIRPEVVGRWGFYVKGDGKFKVLQFEDHADLRRARGIIRECCSL